MKICFFGEVYQALIGNIIGGAELQMALLAKALSENGHEVIVIDTTLDRIVENVDDIKIYNCVTGGIKKLRFFTQKLPNYFRLCYKINADVYYVRGRSYSQIIPLVVGKWFRKKIFIKAISSDIDVLPFTERLRKTYIFRKSFSDWFFRGILTESLFSIILQYSSLLLLQHQGQDQPILSKRAKKYIFHNLFQPIQLTLNNDAKSRNFLLYVGTLSPKKGIVNLSRVIKNSPGVAFHLVGSPERKDDLIFNDLVSQKNVKYHGKQDRKYIISLLNNSKALINPSPAEGFPNTFLESWYAGCPVVALNVDPGGIITSINLGFSCGGDVEVMTDYIDKLSNGYINFDSRLLQEYVLSNHSFESAASKFNLIIENYQKSIGVAG